MNRIIPSIKIGAHVLPPVFLAPMAGITDAAFRETVSDFGYVPMITEMVTSEACVRKNPKTLRMMDFYQGESPKIVQLVGGTPERMAEAVKISADHGADILNINMGCPMKKIVHGEAGAALMRDHNLAKKILHAVVRATSLPVTLKMRLGWDTHQKNALEIARIAEEVGISLIIVHGRTRSQFYTGMADWEAVGEVKKSVRIPVIVNGDIKNTATAMAALNASCADGIMVGRAALGAPWLPCQLASFLTTEVLVEQHPLMIQQTVIRHLDRMVAFYGQERAVCISRKHMCWYSKGLEKAATFRTHVNKALSIQEIKQYVEEFMHEQQ
ncbi:MAG: tRNA dihydrouridine synthase DusB [Holosporales bacterium]|nr:tRNA dihydrouridine synthase DusB [Holosporales bacterium]